MLTDVKQQNLLNRNSLKQQKELYYIEYKWCLKKKKKVVYYANRKNKLLTNFDLKANEQLYKTIQVFIAYCFFLYWLK